MDCNLFGGVSACKTLPSNASYLAQCPGADSKVDCAFYSQVLHNVYDSPVDELQAFVAKQPWAPPADSCPQCYDKLGQLWCALASPRCGTFAAYTRLALLPSLTAAVKAYNRGDNELEALSVAVTSSMDAIGAALPCREMCEDLMSTCSCSGGQGSGATATFGQLLQWMAARVEQTGFAVPAPFQRLLFKGVWDRPFCSLFQPKAQTGFTGACAPLDPAAARCAVRDRWCAAPASSGPSATSGPASEAAGDTVLRYMQGVLVLQMARAATGWITDDDAGLWRTKAALSGKEAVDELNRKYVDGRVQPGPGGPASAPPLSGGQVAGIVVLSVLGAALLALLGVWGYRQVVARRAERSYFELQSGNAFRVLGEDEQL